MAVIKKEEVAGYIFWGCGHLGRKDEAELVCLKCVKDEELKGLTSRDVLTVGRIKEADEIYFCDRCEKMLTGEKKIIPSQHDIDNDLRPF